MSDDKGIIKGTWQFNFNFDLSTDQQETNAIVMLKDAGIDFEKLATHGIYAVQFAKHASMLGLASNSQLTWLAFNSKYDFAYLLSLFVAMPDTPQEFLK